MIQIRTPQGGYTRRQSETLGGIEVQLARRWRAGPGAWYLDVETASGERILSGVRITPDGYIWTEEQDPRLPPGSLAAIGPDPYTREQMGTDVQLIYLDPGETL
jgi:hypothetical protein